MNQPYACGNPFYTNYYVFQFFYRALYMICTQFNFSIFRDCYSCCFQCAHNFFH